MQIHGTYKLKAFIIQSKDGSSADWGKNATGLLIYAPTGYMSVSINKDIENDPAQNDAENRFDSTLFYSGTYTVEGDLIRHQVQNASNPARIGREMLRYVEWSGNQLKLTTPEEAFGKAILVWEKL